MEQKTYYKVLDTYMEFSTEDLIDHYRMLKTVHRIRINEINVSIKKINKVYVTFIICSAFIMAFALSMVILCALGIFGDLLKVLIPYGFPIWVIPLTFALLWIAATLSFITLLIARRKHCKKMTDDKNKEIAKRLQKIKELDDEIQQLEIALKNGKTESTNI